MADASGRSREAFQWLVRTRSGNAVGAAAGLLLSVVIAAATLPSPGLPPLVWVVLISLPVFVSVLLLTFMMTGPTRSGVAAGSTVYLLAGGLYVPLRVGTGVVTYALLIFVWPAMMLWQDVCMLGLWPCPA